MRPFIVLLTVLLLAGTYAAPITQKPPGRPAGRQSTNPCPPTHTLKCTRNCVFTPGTANGLGSPEYTCQMSTYAHGNSTPATCPEGFTLDLLQCRRQVECGDGELPGGSFISQADPLAACYHFENSSCEAGMTPFLMQCFSCPDDFVYAGGSVDHPPCVQYENLPPCGGGVLKDGVCV